MKQTPKWKKILQMVAAALYIVALVALVQCAMHGIGALAVILLALGSNVCLAVFGGVTASIALEEERYYYEMQNACLALLLSDRNFNRIENELRKAEQLRKVGAPCQFYEYVDAVAELCDKEHDGTCNPDECWVKVKKYIAENGKSND